MYQGRSLRVSPPSRFSTFRLWLTSFRSQFEGGVQSFWSSLNKATAIAVQHPDISSMIYRADAAIYDVCLSFPSHRIIAEHYGRVSWRPFTRKSSSTCRLLLSSLFDRSPTTWSEFRRPLSPPSRVNRSLDQRSNSLLDSVTSFNDISVCVNSSVALS